MLFRSKDILDCKEQKVIKVILVRKVQLEHKEQKVIPVRKVFKDTQYKVLKEMQVHLVQLVNKVHKVLKVTRVYKVCKDKLVLKVCKEEVDIQ